jgi:peptidoglycan/LPS O-acetylase OafA/YrhL
MLMETGASNSTRAAHFTDLDGLRGLLALSVVFLHFGINAGVQHATHGAFPGFLLQLSVDFFFVLSGFVLAHSTRDGVDLMTFARRRVWRLLPVYFVTLAAVVLLGFLAQSDSAYLTRSPSLVLIGADAVLAYPLVAREPLNVPAWSITWELYLPILAVAVAKHLPIARMAKPLLVGALVGSCALVWLVALGSQYYGARAAVGLLLGAMLYRWQPQVPGKLLFPLLGAMMVVMGLALRFPPLAILFPPIAAGVVLAGMRTTSVLSSRPVAFLGRISYTLYMVHVPVLIAVLLISGSLMAKVLALLISISVAAVLSTTIERWGMSQGYRRT